MIMRCSIGIGFPDAVEQYGGTKPAGVVTLLRAGTDPPASQVGLPVLEDLKMGAAGEPTFYRRPHGHLLERASRVTGFSAGSKI
jgi:hypothetical protein